MSRSLDKSRPFRAGRHRAEAEPFISKPLTPTIPEADGNAGSNPTEAIPTTLVPTAPTSAPGEPASGALRRSRSRRPAFAVPTAPETSPIAEAPPASAPFSSPTDSSAPDSSAPETAPIAAVPPVGTATRRSRSRRAGVEESTDAGAVATPGSVGPVSPLGPQLAAAFASRPDAVLRKAASVRVVGQRMAVVAGALAVLLGVGAASQATELPFFGKESSTQGAAGASEAKRAASGTQATSVADSPSPWPTVSNTPPASSSGTPLQAAPSPGGVPVAANRLAAALPSIVGLPLPVAAPTLPGIVAATSSAAPPASPSSNPQRPPASSTAPTTPTATTAPAPTTPAATTAPPTTAAPAATPTPSASPATAAPSASPATAAPASTAPTTAAPSSPAPSPTTAPATDDGAADDTVNTGAYARARLSSYGWGAEQMNALNALWNTAARQPASQVDRGLSYIKQRYGSPAKALEFRATYKWY